MTPFKTIHLLATKTWLENDIIKNSEHEFNTLMSHKWIRINRVKGPNKWSTNNHRRYRCSCCGLILFLERFSFGGLKFQIASPNIDNQNLVPWENNCDDIIMDSALG